MRRRLLALTLVVGAGCWWYFGRGDPVVDTAVPAEVRAPAEIGQIAAERPAQPRLAGWAAISGRVRDARGRPISGATVCAAGWSRLLDRRDREARSCGASEDDGRYRIAGLWPVPHSVHASAPHFIPDRHRPRRGALVSLRAGDEATDVDITLQGGGVELRGAVYDLGGGVLEGALVSAGGADGGSDAEGQFSLWVAPGQVHVTARAEGYAPGAQPGVAPGQWFELRLTPESVLVGKVVRAGDHAPLADASVFAHESSAWQDIGPAISDADGNFRVEGLLPGTYRIEARHDEAYGMASESAVLGLGETSAMIVIAAHPAYLVEGTVEFADGEPCPGGRVQLSQGTGSARAAAIEPDGRVHVQGVLPGSYSLGVECDGAASLPAYPAIEVVDAPVTGQRWQVERGQAIRGEVVLATGEAVPDLWLRVEAQPDLAAPRAHTSGTTVNARTGADGSFTLAGLLPGRYVVRVGSSEYPEPEQPVQLELRDGHDLGGVRISLPATGELRGTVKDGDGIPVKAVEVQLAGGRGSPTARTADDGSFRLAHVAAGEYRAIASADGEALRGPGGAEDAPGVPVRIRVGAVEEVQIVVVPQRGEIRGRVLDGDGGPVTDALVEPTREQGPGAALERVRQRDFFGETRDRRLTDSDGRFVLGGLGEGSYTLLARRRGGGEGTRERVAVGSEVEIQLAEPAQLAGRIRIAGGDAPQEFSVTVHAAATGFRATDRFFRTGGVFRFPEVPAGTYSLVVEAPEGTGAAGASVGAGERVDVQVELAARVTARGRVVDLETGTGVPGMQVAIAPRGQRKVTTSLDRASGAAVTDEQGRFELAQVGVGPATLSVLPRDMIHNGYPFTGLEIEVPVDGALAPVRLPRLRVADGEAPGELGFTTGKTLMVTTLARGGPGARAGLQVGDQIVHVDGHAVTGDAAHLFFTLTRVPPGTRLRLGLARGVDVELTAGAAR